MKFKVESNWLIKTEEDIELDPKQFLHCSDIEELNGEITDYINNKMEYPPITNGAMYEECLGTKFWDTTYGEFMLKWQELKGLPREL